LQGEGAKGASATAPIARNEIPKAPAHEAQIPPPLPKKPARSGRRDFLKGLVLFPGLLARRVRWLAAGPTKRAPIPIIACGLRWLLLLYLVLMLIIVGLALIHGMAQT
jgi:hypothetical protein